MASGELLRKLFQSYKRRDDQAFATYAQQIVAEERGKNHHLLAEDLERILNSMSGDARRSPALGKLHFDGLPHDREHGGPLVEVRHPQQTRHDIVLDDKNQCLVESIVREFHRSDVLITHGLEPSRRFLFCGPPGCGKTLCAEVLAYELDLPLLYTRFDSIISSYLGETASNLRKVFEFASRGQWVILFDEFDAIGKSRDDISEHGELKRVVNSFLQIVDSFRSDSIIIAATNHEHLIDAALWRRFDEVLYFGIPSLGEIRLLLEVKLRSVRHAHLDLERLAPRLEGMSHADIERVCRDAMKACLLNGDPELSEGAFERALRRQRRRLEIAGMARHHMSSS